MAQTTHHVSNDRPVDDGNGADPPRRPAARGSRIAVLGAVAVGVVVFDQLAKSVALHRLPAGVPIPIVEGLAAFTLTLIPGLAFGILRTLGPEHWWLMALVAMAAIALLAHLAVTKLPDGGPPLVAAFGLILGGATGNLIDRVRLGGVVDFIDLSWGAVSLAGVQHRGRGAQHRDLRLDGSHARLRVGEGRPRSSNTTRTTQGVIALITRLIGSLVVIVCRPEESR